jgi:hypothetical protein
MTFPNQVKTQLLKNINEMADDKEQFVKNPGADFTRLRKLSFGNLVQFLISRESDSTSHELLKFFDYDVKTISASAFYQQRHKLNPAALPYLLQRFNSQFPLPLYKNKYNLVACDGAEFTLPRNTNDHDTFFPPTGKSERGYNMIHTTFLYEFLGKRYLDCIIKPARNKNEYRAICDLADRYPYTGLPILIADRGFASYNVFAHTMENEMFFLIRAKDLNVKRLLKINVLPDVIDNNIEIILTRSQSKKNRKRPDLASQYRHVSSNTDFDFIAHGSYDEYPMRLRIVRFQIAEDSFENIITNLPDDEFSPNDIKHLYNLRWKIETSFRDIKHTIGITHFISKKLEYIEQEIWARLILFNFCAIIAAHVIIIQKSTKHVYQINFAMAIKICKHFLRIRERDPPLRVEALIGNFVLPIRLDRSFARQQRIQQLPASFCYRFS